jgi:hypothetical protein
MARIVKTRHNPRHIIAVQLLLVLLGVVLVLAGSEFKAGTQPSLALFSLGTATITTTLFAMVTSAFGTDIPSLIDERIGFQKDTYEKGLHKVDVSLGDDTIFERFDQARSIDLMYNTGKSCCHRNGSRIARAIRQNKCDVRFLIADPNNSIFDDQEVIKGLCPGTDVRSEIRDVLTELGVIIQELQDHTPPVKGGSLELRVYPCLPTNSIVIVDNAIARHIPYLPYTHSTYVPVYDIVNRRSGELFEQYRKTFDRVWKESHPVIAVQFGRQQRPKNQQNQLTVQS